MSRPASLRAGVNGSQSSRGRALAIREDALQARPDTEMPCRPAQDPEGQGIVHAIAHLGSSRHIFEFLVVMPMPVESGKLQVGEARLGIKCGNQRTPAEGHAMEAEAVLDHGALRAIKEDVRFFPGPHKAGAPCAKAGNARRWERFSRAPRGGLRSSRRRASRAHRAR